MNAEALFQRATMIEQRASSPHAASFSGKPKRRSSVPDEERSARLLERSAILEGSKSRSRSISPKNPKIASASQAKVGKRFSSKQAVALGTATIGRWAEATGVSPGQAQVTEAECQAQAAEAEAAQAEAEADEAEALLSNGTADSMPQPSQAELEAEAKAIFIRVDKHRGNAEITKTDLKKFLQSAPDLKQQLLAGGGWQSLFEDLDADGNEKFSLEEFQACYVSKCSSQAHEDSTLHHLMDLDF